MPDESAENFSASATGGSVPTNPLPVGRQQTVDRLIAFERDIAAEFDAGNIRAPIHLSGGNEAWLIAYFTENFRKGDWVCTTWRSHYHALLADVPADQVKAAIMAGCSITLCFPEYNVISSAIVGGILPIAVGIAMAIKRRGGGEHVHVFVGDMAARGGAYHEATQYAAGHDLPINFVIEDNEKSVMTPTAEVWGTAVGGPREFKYLYSLPWPHAGAGRRVQF